MAPPLPSAPAALLPVSVLFLMVKLPSLRMPAPEFAFPPVMVRLEIFTFACHQLRLKTRLLLLPLITRLASVGPAMVCSWPIASSPLVKVIGLVTCPGDISKVTLPPEHALFNTSRKLPGPLSLLLLTINTWASVHVTPTPTVKSALVKSAGLGPTPARTVKKKNDCGL